MMSSICVFSYANTSVIVWIRKHCDISVPNIIRILWIKILKTHLSKVPEAPKKAVPEEKVPVPVPKKVKAPPARGTAIICFLSFGKNILLSFSVFNS